jgi:two-component system, OmpR family, alkaline phosphatase synthesis response regulator PhoP
LLEIKHDRLEAQKFYRAALEIDPTYRPAGENLERITSRRQIGPIDLGEVEEHQ